VSTSGGPAGATRTSNTFTGPQTITDPTPTDVPLTINGAAAQTADLLDITASGQAAGSILKVVAVANPVNGLVVTPSAAGSGVTVGVGGTDANVTLNLTPKGGGNVNITTGNLLIPTGGGIGASASGARVIQISDTAAAVNIVQIANAATGSSPVLSAVGTDPNIGLSIQAKGTGGITLGIAGNLLGLYGAAPVARAAAITAPAATASTNVTPFGYTTAAQADAIVTAVRAMQVALQGLGVTL
jgi:hypothetical protein